MSAAKTCSKLEHFKTLHTYLETYGGGSCCVCKNCCSSVTDSMAICYQDYSLKSLCDVYKAITWDYVVRCHFCFSLRISESYAASSTDFFKVHMRRV